MSRMLLSIKPEYVNKIISGKKKYEFRKFHCREGIDTIVIYATAPMKKDNEFENIMWVFLTHWP